MKIEAPHNKQPNDEKTFSVFGTHQLNNKTVLHIPNNTITMQDIGDGKFAYVRHSENEQIRKIIQVHRQTSHIEMAPVLPVHVPAYKTDFFFMRFEQPFFIEQNSSLRIEVDIPIEIGIFLASRNKTEGLDFFSCDHINSRFGLYGTPEEGRLCKYSVISATKDIVTPPFTCAKFRIKITNELHGPASVGKIVFPITDHDLHYRGNDVIMDGLHATIKNRVGLHIIETVQDPIAISKDWMVSPRDTEKTDYKFSMEMGFD